ncbi:MAG: NIPSNAP family containing protein [Sphingobacteriales bacterium]|nr:MAG: NIPSNAP family containing protein [Sphingobacteriales bacterium]
MKKNSLLFVLTLLLLTLSLSSLKPGIKPSRSIYQLTVYHYKTAEQEKALDAYLQNALLPALHRQQIKNIGVFKNHANDTAADKTLYVYTPYTSLNAIITVAEKLKADKDYQTAGAEYINAVYNNPPYSRMENILLQAFPLAPQMELPDLKNERKERVYELRSYESATEKIFANKVHMFNEGDEIGLFKRLHFNAVFYGEVVSGSKMPNLMYITCHENKAAREANWKNFGEAPEWKKLISMPEYSNNVSHIDINFLYPTAYSDF